MKRKAEFSYPPFVMPVSLVGANVGGKPNFEAIAWFCLLDHKPRLIGLSSVKSHFTNRGIRENRTFSVNIPSTKLVVETDFCGLHSGANVDKSGVFDVFYGELKTAPMITECPVNLECRLKRRLKLLHGEFFIGEVAGVYMDDECLTEGKPDLKKIDPLLFEGSLGDYWKIGDYIERVSEPGKAFKPKGSRERRRV